MMVPSARFSPLDSAASMQAVADKYAAIVAAGGWPKVPGGKLEEGLDRQRRGAP